MSNTKYERIVIRPFQPGDKPQGARLFDDFQDYLIDLDPLDRLCRQEGYGEVYTDRTVAETSKEGAFMVAEREEVLLGLVAGFVKRQKPEDLLDHRPSVIGTVTELYVSPEARGGGIGKALLDALEAYFRLSGCDVSFLEVFTPNQLARHFYDRQGYTERDVELIKQL